MNNPHILARQAQTRLSQVKKTLHRRFAEEFQHILPLAVIRRAIDEAEQVAHTTEFPHLVFPLLAEETIGRVSRLIVDDASLEPALAAAAA